MQLIIAGSRDINEELALNEIIKFMFYHYGVVRGLHELGSHILNGACPTGVDKAALRFADIIDMGPCTVMYRPNWETEGKKAGPLRNKRMAKDADALLLIWDGKSKGSASMKKEMEKLNKPIYEVIIKA